MFCYIIFILSCIFNPLTTIQILKSIFFSGNKNLLQCDETWEALIKHYTVLGCMVNAEDQNLTPLKRPGRRY